MEVALKQMKLYKPPLSTHLAVRKMFKNSLWLDEKEHTAATWKVMQPAARFVLEKLDAWIDSYETDHKE